MPNSYIFWWFPPPFTFLIFLTVLQYSFLAPHYFLFLFFLCIDRSLLLAILDFMLLIPISPLIAACAAHFGAHKILLIAVFSAFCNVSFSSPFMSITSAQYKALGSTHSFPICFPHQLLMATFFDYRVCHHAQSLDFFIISFFCPSNTFLFDCTITL